MLNVFLGRCGWLLSKPVQSWWDLPGSGEWLQVSLSFTVDGEDMSNRWASSQPVSTTSWLPATRAHATKMLSPSPLLFYRCQRMRYQALCQCQLMPQPDWWILLRVLAWLDGAELRHQWVWMLSAAAAQQDRSCPVSNLFLSANLNWKRAGFSCCVNDSAVSLLSLCVAKTVVIRGGSKQSQD